MGRRSRTGRGRRSNAGAKACARPPAAASHRRSGRTDLATLVGLELRPRRLREAAALWWAVTEQRGISGRDAIWGHPDLLPTADDLADPLGFAERTADDGSDPLERALGILWTELWGGARRAAWDRLAEAGAPSRSRSAASAVPGSSCRAAAALTPSR